MRDPSDVATRRARHWPEARQVLSHPDFHHGFREVQSGRPFDHRRADALPRLGQIRYENGRQIAAECAALGLAVDWPSPGHIPPALKHLVLRRLQPGRR
ncbi:hypothetical protein [Inquilinus sp.]|uniref:hypothetical protein n=1 Tax=Inquilinus sp. TaxID=1932117 RepID=UPI003783CA1C